MSASEIVFWLAVAIVAYAYVGYPFLITLAAKLSPKRVRKERVALPVSIVIVAHDEETTIGDKIRNCLGLDYPSELVEILVVSDGSTDATEDVMRGFASQGVRLLALPGPQGKASCLNRAVPETTGEILLLTDARQRLEPRALSELVANFADPAIGAASGELHLSPRPGASGGEGVGLYWRYEKYVRRMESSFDATVGATGALYAVRKRLFRPLDPRLILDDVAIPMDVALSGHRVVFEPRAAAHDQVSETPSQEFRRKVRTLAGNYQLAWLRPELLHPFRNRLWWQFLSHKISRLAVPWMLLAALGANGVLVWTPGLFYPAALAIQGVFYLLAAVAWSLGGFGARPKWLSLPYTFTLLNAAAACSLFRFVRGSESAAWKAGPGRKKVLEVQR